MLLADDNAPVAAQIRALLDEDFEVVGVVRSGEELEAACARLRPAVVVTDVAMPGKGGLAAVRHILARQPGTRVVLVSVLVAAPLVRAGLDAGAQGYVAKEDAADELVPAVEAALAGRTYVSAAGRRAIG